MYHLVGVVVLAGSQGVSAARLCVFFLIVCYFAWCARCFGLSLIVFSFYCVLACVSYLLGRLVCVAAGCLARRALCGGCAFVVCSVVLLSPLEEVDIL